MLLVHSSHQSPTINQDIRHKTTTRSTISTLTSFDDTYAKKKRNHKTKTRRLQVYRSRISLKHNSNNHAIQLGDFCPTCGLRLNPNLRLRATTFDSLTSLPDSEPIYHNLRYQHSSLEPHSTLTSDTEYTLPDETDHMDLADAFNALQPL